MRTTVAINKNISERVMEHAVQTGNRSMAAMVEFMLRKSCDFIDKHGYDAFIKQTGCIHDVSRMQTRSCKNGETG